MSRERKPQPVGDGEMETTTNDEALPTPETVAENFTASLIALARADSAYRSGVLAIVVKSVLDGLIGNDRYALIRGVAGLTPDMVEMITDVFLESLEDIIVGKLS